MLGSVRVAVGNAARHASALLVTVEVTDDVVVEVRDDGRAVEPGAARSGPRNAADGAEQQGRSCASSPAGAGRCDRPGIGSQWRGAAARSSVARMATWVRRSRPSLASRCDT